MTNEITVTDAQAAEWLKNVVADLQAKEAAERARLAALGLTLNWRY